MASANELAFFLHRVTSKRRHDGWNSYQCSRKLMFVVISGRTEISNQQIAYGSCVCACVYVCTSESKVKNNTKYHTHSLRERWNEKLRLVCTTTRPAKKKVVYVRSFDAIPSGNPLSTLAEGVRVCVWIKVCAGLTIINNHMKWCGAPAEPTTAAAAGSNSVGVACVCVRVCVFVNRYFSDFVITWWA